VRTALVLVPITALLLAGCSGSDEGSDTAAASVPMAEAAGGTSDKGAAPAGGTGGTTGGGASAPDRARVTAVERAVVRTATLEVEVDDVRKAADSARALAQGAGGELAGEQTASGTEEGRSVLTLRVPGSKLDATVAKLAALGAEREREVSTEDVTEQLVDLDSRVATQRASVARVRALLERASGLGDVVKIEGELAKREAELESLTARMRAVEDRVAMSTITLTLVGEGTPLPSEEDEQIGFTGGLERGWDAFTATALVVAATTGALLPFLPFVLLAAWLWRRWSRRAAVVPAPLDTRA
jgi:hypothetical protein